MFGSNAAQYCVVIITREEEILNDDKTVEEYLQENEDLKRFVARFHHRYLAINNFASQTERDGKVRELIQIVRNMLKENEKPYYTNEMFEQAKKEYQRKEVEALNLIQADTEARTRELREEVKISIVFFEFHSLM